MKFTLYTAPVSVNRMYGGKRYLTAEGRAAKTATYYEAKQAGCERLDTPLAITLKWYMPNGKRKDIDNILKCLLDSLTGVCWYDDSQIIELNIVKLLDRANPRIEVEITECLPLIKVAQKRGRRAKSLSVAPL